MPANIFREVFPDIFLKNRHFSGFVVLPRLLGNCRVYRNGVAGIHGRYISCCGAICLLLPFLVKIELFLLKRWLWGKQSFQNMSCKNEKEMVNAWLMISLLTSLTPGRQCAIYRENSHNINSTKKGSGRNNSLFTKVFFGVQNFLFCDVVHLFDRPPPFVRIYPAKDKAIYVSMPLNMCRPMEVNILLIATTIVRKI